MGIALAVMKLSKTPPCDALQIGHSLSRYPCAVEFATVVLVRDLRVTCRGELIILAGVVVIATCDRAPVGEFW